MCIGLVVTNTLYNGNYFSELISQAAKKLDANGRQLILVDGKHSAEEERKPFSFCMIYAATALLFIRAFYPLMKWMRSSINIKNR